MFLRRNRQKYFSWNFQPNYVGYVKPQENNKGYDTSSLPKKIIKKNEPNIELKQSQSDTIPEIVQGHIFKPIQLNYDVNTMEKDISTLTPLNLNQQTYAPKKIITKRNDTKNDKYDTKSYKQPAFQQYEQNNLLGEKNVSQYRKNQIFKLENLMKNQVYYYKFSKNHSQQIDENIHIIKKEI